MDTGSKDLLQGARRFDQQALGEIYDLYSGKLYGYAMRLLGSQDLAEDCVADTFSRFLLALKNGGGPQDHLQAYLYRIAHNWITDTYRRQPPPALELKEELAAQDKSVELGAEEHFQQNRLRNALRMLTEDQRQVIALRFLEEMENEEVAAVMQKEVGAVKALQHRAVASLRRILAALEDRKNEETKG